MRNLKHLFVASVLSVCALLTAQEATAQNFPLQLARPYPYAPLGFSPIEAVPLRPIRLTFDTNIPPLGSAIINPLNQLRPVFGIVGDEARQVEAAFNMARQQTVLCLQYLSANRSNILAGRDPIYNSIFGDFYDPASQATFRHIVNLTHYNRVLHTFSTMNDIMNRPTTFNSGLFHSSPELFGTIFGYDHGQRHWGNSNSDSADMLAASEILNPGTFETPLRWDEDNAAQNLASTATTPLAAYADFTDHAFFVQRMDVLMRPSAPNTIFLGAVFFGQFERANTSPPGSTPGTSGFLRSDLLNPTFYSNNSATNPNIPDHARNGDLSLHVTADGSAIVYAPGAFNSGELPSGGITGVNTDAFQPSRMRQDQLLMAAFSEFTTNLNDPRGGAFWGLYDLVHNLLDPSADMFIKALDAESFGKFAEALNNIGITDPRQFPPRGKNGRSGPVTQSSTVDPFLPIIPSS